MSIRIYVDTDVDIEPEDIGERGLEECVEYAAEKYPAMVTRVLKHGPPEEPKPLSRINIDRAIVRILKAKTCGDVVTALVDVIGDDVLRRDAAAAMRRIGGS